MEPAQHSVGLEFNPLTGTREEWLEAYTRVEDYFRAHRVMQTFLLLRILRQAADIHAKEPTRSPTTIALEIARNMIDEWFRTIITDPGVPDPRKPTAGRVAFILADGPRQWAPHFLADKNLPEEFVQAMRRRTVEAGPDLEISSMVPRPIDLGLIPEVAEDTWDSLEKSPLIRMFLLWILFLLVLGAGVLLLT